MIAYPRSILFKVQILLQASLLLVFSWIDVSVDHQILLCGLLLSTVGIPHGANDYLYRKDPSLKGLIVFVIKYLVVMAGYWVVWIFIPTLALIVFFAVSFHHFGQSNFNNRNTTYYPSLLWGVWVLICPVLLHVQEAGSILADMMQLSQDHTSYANIVNWLYTSKYWILVSIALLYFTCLYKFERANYKYYFIQFLLVTAWYLYTPLLSGFVVVFCLWHALQSIQDQAWFYVTVQRKSLVKFWLFMLPFGLVALSVFAVFLYFFELNIGQLLIVLSLITLPHVFVMNDLYHPNDEAVE
jgi:Brp/Blh family beta-carotene 15,15'-monooxygenase